MKRRLARQIVFYLILLALWQVLIALKVWPEYIFPSPLGVLKSLAEGFQNNTFIVAIAISMKRIAIGYGISLVIGGLLGILVSRFRVLDDTIGELMLAIQTLPSICWFPLALLWFGLNEKAIDFVVIMGALFCIAIAVESGIKNVPPLYIKAGRNMGAKNIRLFYAVIIPAAMPSIVAGLKQGWSFAWRSLMAGELLFANLGIGYLLLMGRELNDMSRVIAVMLVIAFISILVDKLVFGRIESSIGYRWGLGKNIES